MKSLAEMAEELTQSIHVWYQLEQASITRRCHHCYLAITPEMVVVDSADAWRQEPNNCERVELATTKVFQQTFRPSPMIICNKCQADLGGGAPHAEGCASEPSKATEYNIRLTSGRIVEPGPGGFAWYSSDGRYLGGVHSMDWVIREVAAGALGGVGVATRFGAQETVTEFIPGERIESIVKREPTPPKDPYRG